MKLIKSLEEFLYEVMVWLVFYPRTMVMAIFRPLRLMKYADSELGDADEDRYSDTLSPPIFLAITLGLLHVVELMGDVDTGYNGFLADDQTLIAFRLIAFAIFPLMFSLRRLRSAGIALDRKTLRSPFYAQCFAVGPLALGIDSASIMGGLKVDIAIVLSLMIASLLWYFWVQVIWFRYVLGHGVLQAIGNTLRAFLQGLLVVLVLSMGVSSL